MPRNLLFIAGDLSGDMHAALLAREVMRHHADWKIHALGGARLKATGASMIGDTSGLGVIGFASALGTLPRSLQLRGRVLRFLRSRRLDAAVLCDWGGFNGRLLPILKASGVPVLYYFPPRSWQKTGEGGLSICPNVSRVATPFEWSAKRLQSAGCEAEWVGHPLLETVRPSRPRVDLRSEFGVATNRGEKLVAVLPGSRAMELKYIAPQLIGAAQILQRRYQERHTTIRFIVTVPQGMKKRLQGHFPVSMPIAEGRATDALIACDAAMVKSGTASLEAAVADAPQVVVYDGPALLRAQWNLTGLAKKVPFIAMPNIILEDRAVQELIGDDCRPKKIADEVETLLEDKVARTKMQADYERVRRALGADLPFGATERTAKIIEEMLGDPGEIATEQVAGDTTESETAMGLPLMSEAPDASLSDEALRATPREVADDSPRYRQQGFWARRRLRLMMLGMIALPILSWWFGESSLLRRFFWPGVVCTLFGLSIRLWAAGWLRKHEALATDGPYALVRHPLYLGSGLLALGHGTMSGVPFAWAILPMFWLLLHWPALREEEEFLLEKYGEEYVEFRGRVGGLLPRLTRPGVVGSRRIEERKSFSWQQAWHNREYEALSVNALAIGYYAYLYAIRALA